MPTLSTSPTRHLEYKHWRARGTGRCFFKLERVGAHTHDIEHQVRVWCWSIVEEESAWALFLVQIVQYLHYIVPLVKRHLHNVWQDDRWFRLVQYQHGQECIGDGNDNRRLWPYQGKFYMLKTSWDCCRCIHNHVKVLQQGLADHFDNHCHILYCTTIWLSL